MHVGQFYRLEYHVQLTLCTVVQEKTYQLIFINLHPKLRKTKGFDALKVKHPLK